MTGAHLLNHGAARGNRPGRGRGFTLLELMVVVTLMGILVAMTAGSFRNALERSKADIAVANLRSIWAAQRYFWVANRRYATATELVDAGLIDPTLTSGTTQGWYTYEITPDGETDFTATATHVGTNWLGNFSVNQTGVVTGSVQAAGEDPIDVPLQ